MSPPRPVVVVTGAAQRIGRAIALHLGAHGWNVAVHYHRSAAAAAQTVALLAAAGGAARAFSADLSDEAACAALLPAVERAFGRVDAVVNNASLFEHDDVATFSYAALDRHWRANTAPAVLLARALHESVSARDAGATGVVVNLLDQKLWNPNPDHLSYTLSKAALEAATTLLAQALAPRVRVAGVAPGLTLESPAIDTARLHALQAATPLQRGVSADDVAHAVRFVLESPVYTGSTLLVDAGSHLVRQRRDWAYADAPEAGADTREARG